MNQLIRTKFSNRYNFFALFFLCITIISGCADKKNDKVNEAVFKGQITGATIKDLIVEFPNPINGMESPVYSVPIDNEGNFRLQFLPADWSLGKIKLGEKSVYLFIEPGDSIFLATAEPTFDSGYIFSGRGAVNTNYFNNSYSLFESKSHLVDNRNKTKEITSGAAYQKYRDSIKEEHDIFLDKSRASLTESAKKVARAQIDCRWSNTLFDYPTIHLFLNEQPLTPDFEERYHDFAKSVPLLDSALLRYDKYVEYLDNYLDHQLKLKHRYNGLHYNHLSRYDDFGKYKDLYDLAGELLDGKVKYAMQLHYLSTAMERGRFATVKNEFEKFKAGNSYTEYMTAVSSMYDKFTRLDKGRAAPDFKLVSDEGKTISLSDFKGKVVYVDFLASWCMPCLALIPESQKLKERFKGKDVVFVNISIDKDEKSWRSMMQRFSPGGINLISKGDFESPVALQYGINALPRFFLIDKNGNIADNNAKKPGSKEIEDDILKLL